MGDLQENVSHHTQDVKPPFEKVSSRVWKDYSQKIDCVKRMIAIITAMEVEFMSFYKQIRIEGKADVPTGGIFRATLKGKDVVAIQSGIGEERAIRAVRFLIEKYSVRFIISTGVAGALSPELRTGDIVIGEKVLSRKGMFYSNKTMVTNCTESCKELGMKYITGVILTSAEFIASNSKKKSLHEEYGAMAVEMESAFIAEYAAGKGIPFLVIRAISDTADTSFNIDFQKIEKNGKITFLRYLAYFSLHPLLYLELRKHREACSKAVSHLYPLIKEVINRLSVF